MTASGSAKAAPADKKRMAKSIATVMILFMARSHTPDIILGFPCDKGRFHGIIPLRLIKEKLPRGKT
jgi:hypothetical protein